jgi:hypothetical protein
VLNEWLLSQPATPPAHRPLACQHASRLAISVEAIMVVARRQLESRRRSDYITIKTFGRLGNTYSICEDGIGIHLK